MAKMRTSYLGDTSIESVNVNLYRICMGVNTYNNNDVMMDADVSFQTLYLLPKCLGESGYKRRFNKWYGWCYSYVQRVNFIDFV